MRRTEVVARTCSVKSFLENFVKFRGKHLCQSLFFNKVAYFSKVENENSEAMKQATGDP